MKEISQQTQEKRLFFKDKKAIKAASSHERALASAHVGVCAGLLLMCTAQHSCPTSVEQDVRLPARRSTVKSDVFGHQ